MKNNTINNKEIEKFSKIAEEWWNPNGKFKPLHKFNPIRIKYIKENIVSDFKIINKDKPLNGLNLPLGLHHSAAIFENFSISCLFIELLFIVS